MTRQPFYYGPADRPRFAWLHVPQDACNGLAAVLCPSLGHEFVHSYLSLRHLADALARAGVLVLRMEYDGTGNCAGADEEPARVEAWLQSIRDALHELRTDPRARRVGLIGVRMGANLAARIAAEDENLEFFVAWAAIARARDFLRELKAMQLTGEINGHDPRISDGAIEAAGFVYSAETQKDLQALEWTAPRARHVLWAARDDLPGNGAIAQAWREAGLAVTEMRLPGVAEMLLPAAVSVVPHASIAQIVAWVAALSSEKFTGTPFLHGQSHADLHGAWLQPDNATLSEYHVRESLWRFGERESLFGVLTSPLAENDQTAKPLVVMTNAGSVHHMGPHRLYVMLARTLAHQGFHVLRMDISGKGDSDTAAGREENIVYSPLVVSEIEQAIRSLNARFPHRKILLMGLCSGAYDAFHAGTRAHAEIVEAIMINPLSFYWEEGRKITDAPNHLYSQWAHYMRSVRDWRRWVKLLQGKADVREIFRMVARRMIARLGMARNPAAKSVAADGKVPVKLREDLAADLRAIHAQGRKMTFIIADTDPGQDILMMRAGRTVKKLRRRGALTINRIAQANHTFTSRTARRTVIAHIAGYLRERYPA